MFITFQELLKNQTAENVVDNTSNENEMSFSQEAVNTEEIEEDNNLNNFYLYI